VVLACAAAGAGAVLLIGDDDGGDVTGTTSRPNPGGGFSVKGYKAGDYEGGSADQAREVKRTARRYVAAIDARDGKRVCALYPPGVLERLKLPKDHGDCAASISASIGYRDPRGFPVWKRTRIARIKGVNVGQAQARVTMTIVTTFSDRDEPSVEDDIVYLTRLGNQWLITKPDAALYRAIGAPEPPPQAIAPP
jgi:hypothetical protein